MSRLFSTNFALDKSERFALNPDSPLPLYHQMEQILQERITLEGMAGRRLPSETDLVDIFGVSRMTVKKALENLSAKGYLDRRQGFGTIVTRPLITEDLGRLTGFTEIMTARGSTARTQVLFVGIHTPSSFVQSQLGLGPDEMTLNIRRLRGTTELFPIVLLETDIPLRFAIDVNDDFSGSIYKLLEEKHHLAIVSAVETISAAEASSDEAERLELAEGAGVLIMERQTFTAASVPLEYVRGVYRPDRYKYAVWLKR